MVRVILIRVGDNGDLEVKEIDSPEQVLKDWEEGESLLEYPDTKLNNFFKIFRIVVTGEEKEEEEE